MDKDHDIVAPFAGALVESLRAFGYDLPTAIADLVDNSISAGAKNVWIDFEWNGQNSAVVVTDDGHGMSETSLVSAMRPGSQSPLIVRKPHDLGRFGLGLKTASFSQCRRLTVRSRCGGATPAVRCWDLDHVAEVNEWRLLRDGSADAVPHYSRLDKLTNGTAVVWQNLDRLVAGQLADSDRDQQSFLQKAGTVAKHLAMVFHLLMSGTHGVKIHINNTVIAPWDPFLEGEVATQVLATTRLKLHNLVVEVQPFVLPHHSKLSKARHAEAAGPRGWNSHQGFYIYRNRRLLVAGDWLGFGWSKDDHYKLARIRVEVPTSLDHDWSIDVTKSKAHPPAALRDELKQIGELTRGVAKRVYSFRGARLTPGSQVERVFLWQPIAKHNKTFYRVNRDHPLVMQAIATATDKQILNALLRFIEETIPFPHISIENSEKPNSLPGPFEDVPDKQISDLMEQAFRSLVASGYSRRDATNRLSTIWPFELFPALLQRLSEETNHA